MSTTRTIPVTTTTQMASARDVDSGGNAKECLDAIGKYLQAHVQASGSAKCTSGNTCEAEGKVSCHCSTPARRTGSMPAGLAMLGALGLIGVARMRRR